jgi:hypothetical protein
MQQIAIRLEEIADSTPFVANPYKKSDLNNFDTLVSKSLELIDRIEDRAEFKVYFYQICKNLKKYPILKGYIEIFLAGCIWKERYSPLLWLLGGNSDHNEYLSELEQGIKLYEVLPNEKNTTPKRIKAEIKKQLENYEDLGDFLSELLIINRFGEKRIVVKDKKIGNKYIDLEIQLGEKKVLFEIRAPNMQADSKLTGGGFLKNKFEYAIVDKRRQLRDGLSSDTNPLVIADNLYYYVVIDGGKTPIAQDVMDLFTEENQKNDLVSGVIVFRPRENHTCSHNLALSGWIKNNPKGRNVLSKDELNEIEKILFF